MEQPGLLVLLLASHTCVQAQFAPPSAISYAWCGVPTTVRAGDIDGDGDLDLACAARYDGRLTWLVNDGTANFPEPRAIGPGFPGVTEMQLADLDDDGDPDLVATSALLNEVMWAANDGTGTFDDYALLAVIDSAMGLTIADLDQDGDPDLLATGYNAAAVFLIENMGSGTFNSAATLTAGMPGAKDVDLGDIDGDGDDDLVISAYATSGFHWCANDGAGNFGAPQLIDASNTAQVAEVADLDGDGDLDIATGLESGMLRWHVNDGTGTFTVGAAFLSPSPRTRCIVLEDLDDDGDTDILAVPHMPPLSGQVSFIENLGGGTFAASEALYGINSAVVNAVVADIDGDGALDIAYTGTSQEEVGWMRGNGDGTFAERRVAAPPAQEPANTLAADLDGDGDLDALIGSLIDGKVNWCENDGAGGFSRPRMITDQTNRVRGMAVADLDGDGDTDVISASSNDGKVAWYANDGSGGFGPQQVVSSALSGNYAVAPGDLEGDGDVDLIATRTFPGELVMFLNDGQGVFGAYQTIVTGLNGPRYAILGDLDGDDDLDAAVSCWNDSSVNWLSNNGDATFGILQSLPGEVPGAYYLQLSDLDGNGLKDLVCSSGTTGSMVWFPNNGGGVFGAVQTATSAASGAFAIADLDTDGDEDLAIVDDELVWCANLGGGVFGAPQTIGEGAVTNYWLTAGDLDGDGDPDLISALGNTHEVVMYENHSDSPFMISGRIFNDANSSGAYDSGEGPFPFIGVTSAPYETTPYATGDGTYTFYLSEDEYTIGPLVPDALWSLTTPSQSYTIALTSGSPTSTGNDFGYVPNGEVNDLIVSLSPLMAGCNGETSQWITWGNSGNTRPSGLVAYTIDPLYTFISAEPLPTSVAGSTLYWMYSDLAYYAETTVHIRLGNPDETQIGQSVVNTLAVTIDENGSPMAVFTDQSLRTVACAYDPNDKVVDPVGYGEEGVVDIEIPFFEYTVRFQNTGNATANTVTVRDQLDASLDRTSIQLVGTSHTLTDMRIEVDGELVFTFGNIQLPDSNANEPDSHGFVTFRASPLEGTPSGTTIATRRRSTST